MTIDTLLNSLDAVKQRGRNQWLARCPGHDDQNPSLSVLETSDGTILIHCFAGCSAADVVAAIGLEISDLFSRNTDVNSEPGNRRRSQHNLTGKDVCLILNRAALIVAIASEKLSNGEELNAHEKTELLDAHRRIEVVGSSLNAW